MECFACQEELSEEDRNYPINADLFLVLCEYCYDNCDLRIGEE